MDKHGLPLGYPKEGKVSGARTPAVTVCQEPGCAEAVTTISVYDIQAPDGQIYLYLHQLCDFHASENELGMRARYTWRPPTATWRPSD